MTYCNGYHPTHQAQLTATWGGKYGGVNCTPCSAGMAAQAHTCGASLFTGAQIRAASNEPIPDPASPGMNLSQAHAALLSLSGGEIDLDVRYAYDFTAYQTRLIKGAQAVLQGRRRALIENGQGYGNTFTGGHAIHTGYDAAGPWFDDPLTGRHTTTWAVLRLFAGSLVITSGGLTVGFGKVYAMFTRDITAVWKATCRPLEGQTYRTYTRYFVKDGRITDSERRRTKGFQIPCTGPRQVLRKTVNERVSLVQIAKPGSSMDGWWISALWAKEYP